MIYVVAKDGTGDFTSLQAAVDHVPEGRRGPTTILVKRGVFKERVVVNKDDLRIVGEDARETVLTWSAYALQKDPDGEERGTFLSFTLLVTGRNVTVESLSIRNDAGDGRKVGQAVAVYAAGDRGRFLNCRMIAHQDTLFCGPMMPKILRDIAPYQSQAECVPAVNEPAHTAGRVYFEGCFIEGDVDFIFGSYRCWFEQCALFMGERGGWYTAANTPEDQPFGFVFHRCRLSGDCGEGKAFLGRPWRKYARVLFLHCRMDERVSPQGFADWDEARKVTDLCGEYGTFGPRADQTPRHPRQKRLTKEEASVVTVDAVLGGWDHWQPEKTIPTWYLCGDSILADYPPSRYPMMGWGQALPALLPERAWVNNCAVNGRSSKSFMDEGRLESIRRCLKKGDTLVVAFAHNDEKQDPARFTDPKTTFPACLRQFIQAAREKEAAVILATPVARRHFDENGRLLATHGAYPDAIRKVAKEENVPLADLESATMALVEALGKEGSKALYCHVPPGSRNYPEGAADNSHLREEGAIRVARLFLQCLRDPKQAPAFPSPAASQGEPLEDLIRREDDILSP